jgi:hypothetical protein
MRYLLIFCLLMAGCSGQPADQWTAMPLDLARSSSLVAKYNTISSSLVVPKGPQIGDQCPDCGGTGVVGDTVVTFKCEKCDGDGRIDEKDLSRIVAEDSAPQKEEKKELGQSVRNEIIMYTNSGCYWCEKWKLEVEPKLKSKGWKITHLIDSQNPIPNFKMYISGVEVKHSGFMSVAQFNKYFNDVKKKTTTSMD